MPILSNAKIVLPDEIINGSLAMEGGTIADLGSRSTQNGAVHDLEGDYLIPGLLELHTDHLEQHYAPRPRVRWNAQAAVQAHDAQIASSGITTVFDALRLGMDEDANTNSDDMVKLAGAIETGRAEDRLRADHFIHLRCEVSAPDVMTGWAKFEGNTSVRIASLMDHTPGQRQFTKIEYYKAYYQGKTGISDADFDIFVKKRTERAVIYADKHRRAISDAAARRSITLASHDDATIDHVAESIDHGVHVAEFPTTVEAAEASHNQGLAVLMGAPNIVRGGSHSGNVAAADLAELGTLDVLSSDYVPFSMIQAVFMMADEASSGERTKPLHQTIKFVTSNPARAIGMDDRGALEVGKRADLVQVRWQDGVAGGVPVVRAVWRQGVRVL